VAKQPYFMTRVDGAALVFGGIWSPWGAGDAYRLTFSVLTLPAEGELALVHHRMPLVLEPARWEEWLRSPAPTELLAGPGPQYAAGIELRPVSAAVGDVRNDGSELVRRVALVAVEKSPVQSQTPTLF
jgi:putative SOS response-associated peptidase YedK